MNNFPGDLATPDGFASEEALDDFLTRPSAGLVDAIRSIRSPLIILGAGGKMGPTLAVRARRAAISANHSLEIVAVSRFSNPASRIWLESNGVQTISADLLDRDAVMGLPNSSNLVYLVGMKSGTSTQPALTWAINTLPVSWVMERYRGARVVALSTGNVYPLSLVGSGGWRETDALTPLGEYSNAAVARERLFEFLSRRGQTPVALMRLSYALDLRYGVLVDLAQKILEDLPISLETGYFNAIWQGDANDLILRSFPIANIPAEPFNLTGGATYSIRQVAERLGQALGRLPRFAGVESDTALLSQTSKLCRALAAPWTSMDSMISWTADWLRSGGRTLNRPTHFETRDGKY